MITAPEAINPVYCASEPNAEILLFNGPIDIEQEGICRTFDASVRVQFSRGPVITVDFDRVAMGNEAAFDLGSASLQFDRIREPVNIGISKTRFVRDVDGLHHVHSARVLGSIDIGPARRVSRVVAHLANFHDLAGDNISGCSEERRSFWRGRISLIDSKWAIRVDSRIDQAKYQESLKAGGGYAITHVMSIERSDAKTFSDDKRFEKLLHDLGQFLSFIRGISTEPFLCVGFDSSGNRVWEKWKAPQVDRYQIVEGWFRELEPKPLEEFWPLFRDAMADAAWGAILRRSLGWYLAANKGEGGLAGAIVLAQTAHELLSWTRFVTENRLSEKGFGELPAADKIRLMLSNASITSEIPKTFAELKAAMGRGRSVDGPEAVTRFRNAIVHPKKKELDIETVDPNALEQAWTLTMWYLDLGLLNLLGYQGEYTNRTVRPKWRGESERVPW